ncbi:hypothetical protein TIFTF001_010123 [Ficus carica]|uniref:DUF668 domain-containing protein n=1 Tax=Ficus carica TaxID=3494 RepID=A0AA88ABM6_FICCA|nr:hypothetical protein TIFTF001_010123 [Ficus carica]
MALETWLIKVKTAISSSFDVVKSSPHHHHHHRPKQVIKKSNIGVLAFEIAGLMSKLIHIWQFLSDKNMIRLRNDSISLEGVRKIISNDDAFLLGLACAEIVENLRLLANSVSRISSKCEDSTLRSFDRLFHDFADAGKDPHGWVLTWKDMEAKQKKMDRYITVTATLYRETDELSIMESGLKKALHNDNYANHQYDSSSIKEQKIVELQQKILWQRQEVKYLKERSLWSRSFDSVTSVLARSIFTILARTKLVFGIGSHSTLVPPSLPRSLSASATVHPSDQNPTTTTTSCYYVSGPLIKEQANNNSTNGRPLFFESNAKLLKPPGTTLGAAALAIHYANVIIVMEKMIKSPQLVGVEARDDLYAMLPSSVRAALRGRLRGVGFSASDPVLATEWREALGRILAWLSPLAHNMIKWQNERSLEQQNLAPKTNVLLFQTLFFANKDKTEAAITELLVGLNYIWRFEREMTAKAFFECNNNLLNLQSSTTTTG